MGSLLLLLCVGLAACAPASEVAAAGVAQRDAPNERWGPRPVFDRAGETLTEVEVPAASATSADLTAYVGEGDCFASNLRVIRETAQTVELEVAIEDTTSGNPAICRMYLRKRPVRVHLDALLGDRRLVATVTGTCHRDNTC